jgi:sn-glycerol 3-phosphate transport system permease protein
MIFAFPIYTALIGSTHDAATIGRGDLPLYPGPHAVENYTQAWSQGSGQRVKASPVAKMMANSFVMAIVIAAGKIAVSLISAYAVVFFVFPLRMVFFWMIFITLMLPVEVRIIPTFKVVSDLHLINTFGGLTIPLIASATATLLFRQFFMTIPDELVEAAKIDGAGPLRFFRHILLPLSRTNIAALFVILFLYGWNQYLWPLLITTSRGMDTIVIGITKMIGTGDAQTDWTLIMSTAVLAMLPPVAVILLMQRWFVRGLVETEK